MEVQVIFNILLLSLSLTTVLLTLVSYLIYRYRQTSQMLFQAKPQRKMEGAFFSRYLPDSASADTDTGKQPQRWLPRYLPQTLGGFFLLAVLVIAGSLLFQSNLHEWIAEQKEAGRDARLDELRGQGLLQAYDLDPQMTEAKFAEAKSSKLMAQSQQQAEALKSLKICLVKLDQQSKGHETALKSWQHFLKKHNLTFVQSAKADCDKKAQVVILPQLQRLNDRQRKAISAIAQNGTALFATGAIGTLNGLGRPESANWAKGVFGVALKTEAPSVRGATVFATNLPLHWNLPETSEINWPSVDEAYSVKSYQGRTVANRLESEGITTPAVQLNSSNKVRTVWSALDPAPNTTPREMALSESALISTLSWIARQPAVHVAPWKGQKTPVVLSVTVKEKPEQLGELLQHLEPLQSPLTLFVSPQSASSEAFADIPPQHEVALLMEEDAKNRSLEERFDQIQGSRLDLEEISSRPVSGVWMASENADLKAMVAADANHLSYVAAEKQASKPIWMGERDLLFFGQNVFGDEDFKRRKILNNGTQITALVTQQLQNSQKEGTALFLNLHTHLLGDAVHQDELAQFLQALDHPDLWKTNYAGLRQWLSDREKLRITFAKADKKMVLKATNTSAQPLEGVVVEYDLPGASESVRLPASQSKLSLPKLNPGETLLIPLD